MLPALAFEQTAPIPQLDSARVVEAAGKRVCLEFSDSRAWATVALAYPYQVASGDVVLAITAGETWYVIGILEGAGQTMMTVPADLMIQAPRGRIELAAAGGIELRSPRVKVAAARLELVARTISERFGHARRWVRDAFQLRAGRIRTLVDTDYRVNAERIIERAERDVKIDGDKIHLG